MSDWKRLAQLCGDDMRYAYVAVFRSYPHHQPLLLCQKGIAKLFFQFVCEREVKGQQSCIINDCGCCDDSIR